MCGNSFSSSRQISARVNQQFSMSKLGRHTSSSETQLVTRRTKRKSLEMEKTFTTDLVRRVIKSCRNSKAFGPDKLSIFHLKHLGPRVLLLSATPHHRKMFLRTQVDGIPPSSRHQGLLVDWWPPPFNQQVSNLHGIRPQIRDLSLCVYVGAVEQVCCCVWF